MSGHLPGNIKDAIDAYVEHRLPPGSFTQAVLENDLMKAVGHADMISYASLREICMYVCWEIPGDCHGSKEKVAAWLDGGVK